MIRRIDLEIAGAVSLVFCDHGLSNHRKETKELYYCSQSGWLLPAWLAITPEAATTVVAPSIAEAST